jgi:hypothetical protein
LEAYHNQGGFLGFRVRLCGVGNGADKAPRDEKLPGSLGNRGVIIGSFSSLGNLPRPVSHRGATYASLLCPVRIRHYTSRSNLIPNLSKARGNAAPEVNILDSISVIKLKPL